MRFNILQSLNPNLSLFQKIFYAYDEIFIKTCEFIAFLIKFYTRGDLVLIRRDVFENVGGFDEKINVLEYTDLLNKVSRLGKLRVLPIPVYETSRRLHKWGLKTHYQYWLKAFFLLLSLPIWILANISGDQIMKMHHTNLLFWITVLAFYCYF